MPRRFFFFAYYLFLNIYLFGFGLVKGVLGTSFGAGGGRTGTGSVCWVVRQLREIERELPSMVHSLIGHGFGTFCGSLVVGRRLISGAISVS